MKLEPIIGGKEFEHFVKWVARENYGPNVFSYKIYDQEGIDLYWTEKGEYHVIQCKQRREPTASELKDSLEKDFGKALGYFKADLKEFIFATTASLKIIEDKGKRKTGNSESLLDGCNRLARENNINVEVWSWDYLEKKVLESPFLKRHLLNREEGADLIEETFLEKHSGNIEERNEKECKLEFYGGQEDMQWPGIIRQWDAPRKIYNCVINNIRSSFTNHENVAAVIRGDGGSGKSVFLRRIAFDLRKDYTIYWLGSNISAFLENELIYDVLRHPKSKYIIILEDWYRNIDSVGNKPAANQLLNYLKKTNNAILIIGDRKGGKKLYGEHVLSKNIYDLQPSENAGLLEHI